MIDSLPFGGTTLTGKDAEKFLEQTGLTQSYVSLTAEYYQDLLMDSLKLQALEECGVDNWIGWDDAMELYRSYCEDD